MITVLSVLLVWLIATTAFVIVDMIVAHKTFFHFISFVYAVPVSCLVQLCLRSAWRDFRNNRWLITGMMWGVLVAGYLTVLLGCDYNLWKVFLLGIPGQAAILLWFRMFRKPVTEVKNG